MNTEKERILAEVCDVRLETILKHPDKMVTVEDAIKAMGRYAAAKNISLNPDVIKSVYDNHGERTYFDDEDNKYHCSLCKQEV